MNPNSSLAGTHSASSALAARRAEETRKKLLAASLELDAMASTEGAWMVTAWAGGNAASTPEHSAPGESEAFKPGAEEIEEVEAVRHTPASGPVSYWA